MRSEKLSEAAISSFRRCFVQLVSGATGLVPETEISPVESLPKLEDCRRDASEDMSSLLAQSAVLKLNGGLGTSMGLEKAKSLLPVKDGKTFLDLITEQIKFMRAHFASHVTFILMDSFSTSDDTRAALAVKHADILQEADWELMQNKVPKITASSLEPAKYPEDPSLEWCPPGHGDIYTCLLGSGLMDRLLARGVNYLFVSNSDNLGATMDLDLLSFFAKSGKPFLMEVCERLESDKKGGHLCVRNATGGLTLRESAMCPDADKPHFEDIARHRFFNTNNLWVNLARLKEAMVEFGGSLPLPMIANKKTVNPRDSSTPACFQLETAMGSAIECFADAGAIVVPRTRFAPVKTCSDLFVLRSDAYELTKESVVQLKAPQLPQVKLDDKHYKLVDKMEALVAAPPSLIGCKALTVAGAVKMGAGVVFKGEVKVTNGGAGVAELPAGTYEDQSVTL